MLERRMSYKCVTVKSPSWWGGGGGGIVKAIGALSYAL